MPTKGDGPLFETAPNQIVLDASVDEHTHPRNKLEDGDGRMEPIVPLLAEEHDVIYAIGNGKPAVTDIPSADKYHADIESCLAPGQSLDIRIAALVRNDTPVELVRNGYDIPGKPSIDMLKIFLSGVSNDAGNSVSDVRYVEQVLRATYELKHKDRPLHVKIHAERKFDRTGKRLEMRDREWYAVQHDVQDMLDAHGRNLHLTIAHVSDKRTLGMIRIWRSNGFNVWGEIAAHYLHRCHEDLYESRDGKGTAFQAYDLCWPIYKDEGSMQELIAAAVSGDEAWSHGSDFACHGNDITQTSGVKINAEGEVCGGTSILPKVSKAAIIDLFEQRGALQHLNTYFSLAARKKLGLPPATRQQTYVREDWVVDDALSYRSATGIRSAALFMRGETMRWKRAV